MLADRLISQHQNNDDAILTDMFRLLTSRQPTDHEKAIVSQLFDKQFRHFTNNADAAARYLAVGEKKTETDTPEKLAAWASVANTLFAFDECMMMR